MPFIKLTDEIETDWERRTGRTWWKDPERPDDPETLLRQVSPNTFQVMEGFRYELPAEDKRPEYLNVYDIPAHNLDDDPEEEGADNKTDLASVPRWLWWFVASYGKHTRAALIHDRYVDIEGRREEADHVFRTMLAESNVRFLRRWLMWAAVSLATRRGQSLGGRLWVAGYALHLIVFVVALGYLAYRKPPDWLLLPLAALWWLVEPVYDAVKGPLSVPYEWVEELWEVAVTPHPVAAVVVLGLAGLVWGRRWPLGVVGILLVLVPTVFAWAAYLVVFCVDLAAEAIGWASSRVRGEPRRFERPAVGAAYVDQAGPH